MKTPEQLSEEKYPFLPHGCDYTIETTYDELQSIQRNAFIAGHEAAQRWIPVDENTPKNVELFVIDNYGIVAVAELLDISISFWDSHNPHLDTNNITHYLPIPKLPTE